MHKCKHCDSKEDVNPFTMECSECEEVVEIPESVDSPEKFSDWARTD